MGSPLRLALIIALLAPAWTSEPVRVLHVPDYPPYEYLDEAGVAQGAFIDLYRLWSQATGRPVAFLSMSFSDGLAALAEGRADVITGMTWTAERARRYDFAPAILQERNHILVPEHAGAQRPEDLRGLAIGVVADEVVADEVRRLGAIPRAYPDYDGLIEGLLAGEVSGATTSTEVMLHLLTRRDALGKVRRLDPPLLVTGFRPAVRAGDGALLAAIEAGFADIPTARRREVIERWLPSERDRAAVEERNRWLWWAAGAVAAAAAVAAGLWQINRSLRYRITRATAELADANRLLHGVLDAATEVSIIATDSAGTVTVFNSGAERLTGRRAAEVVGRLTPLAWHDPAEVRERGGGRFEFKVFIASAEREGRDIAEWWYVRPDGSRRRVALAVTPIRTGAAPPVGWLGIAVDITDQRQMEEQLRQAHKMEALGQLAGGVAHDFNNMLAGIMGYAELLAPALRGDERDRAESIVRTCERAAGLCRQLLAFSRKSGIRRRVVDLHAVVSQTVDLFAHGAERRCDVRLALAPEPLHLLGDEHLIASALLNLLVNARDAMPGGGEVQLRTVRRSDGGAGRIVLTVIDHGPGIPPADLTRIFDPFFTTKPTGTGLGLAAVYGIVQEHGGTITASNRPGGGACFELDFPAVAPGEATASASPLPGGGGGRVLLIDDDETVRTVLALGLSTLGWDVRTADTPAGGEAEALAWRPEVLIVDQIMPGCHGTELLARLRRAGVTCPAILLSGYVPEEGLDRAALGLAAVLVKPVRLGDLARSLEACLGR